MHARIKLGDQSLLNLRDAMITSIESLKFPERTLIHISFDVDLGLEDLVKRLQNLDRLIRDGVLEALIEFKGHHHEVEDDLLLA